MCWFDTGSLILDSHNIKHVTRMKKIVKFQVLFVFLRILQCFIHSLSLLCAGGDVKMSET